MGITKSNLFAAEQNQLALHAKVLAHPARIAILQFLLNSKSCINSDLVNELGLAQATISQHLRELKDIALIQGEIEGTRLCYCINEEKWIQLKNEFESFFDLYHKSANTNCC
jgi:predicted transcriptional regulator